MASKSAELSNENVESGSPPEVTDLARYTMGDVDLDPASTEYWNHYTVRARRFYTKEQNGLEQPWFGKMFINPPGTTDDDRIQGSVPRLFWERAIDLWSRGVVECFFWVGFNMSQLQVIQLSPVHPLQFVTNFPAKRVDYLERPWELVDDRLGRRTSRHVDACEGDGDQVPCCATCRFGKTKQVRRTISGPPQRQGGAPRPSYITFVGPREREANRAMVTRFVEGATRLDMLPGALVRPLKRGRG